MTENEALKYMLAYKFGRGRKPLYPDEEIEDALDSVITALQEIQQYREIGTVKELLISKKYIDLAKKHGTIGKMIDECASYEEIGTVEECREAMEKQKAKKPEAIDQDFDYYKCPVCGEYIWATDNINDHKYCLNCGQAVTL